MSRFSGKCDLCDIIEIAGGFKKFKKQGYKVFVKQDTSKGYLDTTTFNITNCRELEYKDEIDLIPYYPYIEIIGVDKKIYLSDKSWVDTCEERYGYHDIYNYYREELAKELEKHKRRKHGGSRQRTCCF